jgi:hypothetical protein
MGNLLMAKNREWIAAFFSGGGAHRFVEFTLFKAPDYFSDIDDLQIVVRVAALVRSYEQWAVLVSASASSFSSQDMIDRLLSMTDQSMIVIFLDFLSDFARPTLTDDSKFVDLCQRHICSTQPAIRQRIVRLIKTLQIADRQQILLSVLETVLCSDFPDDFFDRLQEIAAQTDQPNLIWEKVVDAVITRGSRPADPSPLVRLRHLAPSVTCYARAFRLLASIRNRVSEYRDLTAFFWFLVNEIVFNDMKSCVPTSDVFDLLIFILTQDPTLTPQLIAVITNLQRELTLCDVHVEFAGDCPYRGIRNLGATCYMNATVQQLFMIPPFRYFVLGADFGSEDWFPEFQYAFAQLLFSPSEYVDLSPFVSKWHGWDGQPVNPHRQQDAGEFLQMILERLEAKIPSSTDCFKGKLKYVLKCPSNDELGGESRQDFFILQLEVKANANVEASFATFLAPDHFDEYSFDGFGKAEADRYCCIAESPDFLIIQLKRFQYNLATDTREKFHDR